MNSIKLYNFINSLLDDRGLLPCDMMDHASRLGLCTNHIMVCFFFKKLKKLVDKIRLINKMRL